VNQHPARRVRVSAGPAAASGQAPTRGIALPGAPAQDADAVYVRALMRSQLRLALGAVAGFVVVTGMLTLIIALIPAIDEVVVVGLPLTWILHAFAFYPVIIFFALLYARGAARNERAFRALRDRG